MNEETLSDISQNTQFQAFYQPPQINFPSYQTAQIFMLSVAKAPKSTGALLETCAIISRQM